MLTRIGGRTVFAKESGLLQGTLELLVLKTLSWGPMHGYGIASWIESATGDVLRVEEGSLYPALHRMEKVGYIEAEWQVTEKSRRARVYQLTRQGKQRLKEIEKSWAAMSEGVRKVLGWV